MTAHTAADRLTQTAKGLSPTGAPAMLTLAVDNMHCGGCLRSVERAALKVSGVRTARASLAAKRVSIVYDPDRAGAGDVIEALQAAGFAAAAIEAGKQNRDEARKNYLLRRVAVAGFAAMNIMLISVAVWSGEASDMDPALASAFRWLSALIALPTVAYAGQPFFRSALGALRGHRLNMDVPISLAILLATGMSLYQTLRGGQRSISTPPSRCCSSCWSVASSTRRCVCAPVARRRISSAYKAGWPRSSSLAARSSRSRRMRFVPAIACWFRPARGLAPMAWCWKGRDRSIKA